MLPGKVKAKPAEWPKIIWNDIDHANIWIVVYNPGD